MTKIPNLLFTTLLITITASCAFNAATKNHSYKKSPIPKVPAKQIPGGTMDNWRYLGTSQDGQIAIEINESSINTSSKQIKFEDRKTIVAPKSFNYQGPINNYKYSLSWWSIDCQSQQYYIISTTIYDEYGKLIKAYTFSSSQAIAINSGSIAELQYNYVCHNLNRQIGY